MAWVLVRQGIAYEMDGRYAVNETPLSTTIGGDTVIRTPLGINVVLNDDAPIPSKKAPEATTTAVVIGGKTKANGDIPESAIKLIKEFEGCELQAYDDGVGIWTIGYGATFYQDGSDVKPGQSITKAEADDLLKFHLKKFWDNLKDTPGWSEMSSGQRGALLSFSFNTGWTCGTDGFNTLNQCIETKNWNGVPAAMNLYVNPGTSTEDGLRRRRRAEGALWNS